MDRETLGELVQFGALMYGPVLLIGVLLWWALGRFIRSPLARRLWFTGVIALLGTPVKIIFIFNPSLIVPNWFALISEHYTDTIWNLSAFAVTAVVAYIVGFLIFPARDSSTASA